MSFLAPWRQHLHWAYAAQELERERSPKDLVTSSQIEKVATTTGGMPEARQSAAVQAAAEHSPDLTPNVRRRWGAERVARFSCKQPGDACYRQMQDDAARLDDGTNELTHRSN